MVSGEIVGGLLFYEELCSFVCSYLGAPMNLLELLQDFCSLPFFQMTFLTFFAGSGDVWAWGKNVDGYLGKFLRSQDCFCFPVFLIAVSPF